MQKSADNRERLIIKICQMYYLENLTQKEIAAAIGLSRPQISRILTNARETGLVHIDIRNPFSEEFSCESALEKRFGVHSAIVIHTESADREGSIRALAAPVTRILDETLKNDDTIGVLGGDTMAVLSQNIGYIKRRGLQIAPLAGGVGPEGSARQSNQIAKEFGERLHCQYYQMYTPACVASESAREALMREPEIEGMLQKARQVSVAVVSIGQISPSTTIRYFQNFTRADIEELSGKGAVAVLGQSFINDEGQFVHASVCKRMIGITGEELRRVPHVIAVATGVDKEKAIAGVLKSGCITTLVTDLSTARGILRLQ